MQQPENTQKVSELIARYRQELLELHAKRPTEAPLPAPVTDNWLDDRFPQPDILRDRAALTPARPVAEEPQEAPQTVAVISPAVEAEEAPTYPYTDEDLNGQVPRDEQPAPPTVEAPAYTGYLRVFVFTGDTAEPLAGARVTVTRPADEEGDILFASTTTDIDGFTPVISLPSVSPALTMQPGNVQPYVTYNIHVNADGFSPTVYENVPVYGDNYVTQPAAMVPTVEGQGPNDTRIFPSQGPADL
ncbi:MAG: carboxypeptidase regulatory-like domain-containing protein [Clostridia bacterium]|nr:carboxypeptidase regulatory-like domain-containing protein [Clostridia bacterium]